MDCGAGSPRTKGDRLLGLLDKNTHPAPGLLVVLDFGPVDLVKKNK